MRDIHFVSVSSGISSAATLLRVFERYPAEDIFPVFCDTKWEDSDNYRFVDDLEYLIDKPIHRIAVGKSPSDVSDDQHMIFNSRVAKCTQVLKTEPIERYVQSLQGDDTRVFMHIGFNLPDRYSKARTDRPFGRLPAPVANWRTKNVFVKYPLWFSPRVVDPRAYVESYGLRVPRIYDMKAEGLNLTANCGGGCFKAGAKYWRGLLEAFPERFEERMNWEANKRLDPKFERYAILQKTENGIKRAFPLSELKAETEAMTEKQRRSQLMVDDIDSTCAVECQVF